MTALAADRVILKKAGGSRTLAIAKIKGAVKVYKGGLAAKNAAGYVLPASNTAGLKVIGVFEQTVDNTAGADGALSVQISTGVFKFANDGTNPCVQADMFGLVYATDDQTVRTRAGSLGVAAGSLEQIDSDGVWIKVEPETLRTSDDSPVTDTQTTIGIPVVYTFDIADAASADYDRVVDEKIEVVEVIAIKNAAGAGNTTTIKNGATAITDAMATAVDKTITRPATIDRAQNVILAGGTLRVSVARAAGSGAVKVIVFAVRR